MSKLMMTRKKSLIYVYNPELKKTVRYDLKRKVMQAKSRKNRWHDVKTQYPFFRWKKIEDIESAEEKFMGMIKKTKELNPHCYNISSFIARLNDALIYENYIAEGIATQRAISYYDSRSFNKHGFNQAIGVLFKKRD